MKKTLNQLDIGEKATIEKIEGKGALRRRLLDMGVTKGEEVYISKKAPMGDPIGICIRGYELAFRKDDAKNIVLV